jgi:hypothetical protein
MLMGWVWDQSAGELRRDGKLVSKGYAGYRATANDPSRQAERGMGPIPRGIWRMTGVKNSPNTGPFTIVLEPEPGTDTCGRSAFRIHGDNSRGDRSASHGCIILPRTVRETIWRSGQRLIEVIA